MKVRYCDIRVFRREKILLGNHDTFVEKVFVYKLTILLGHQHAEKKMLLLHVVSDNAIGCKRVSIGRVNFKACHTF